MGRSDPRQRPVDVTTDRWGRPLGALRISVTDRCNLRCQYCMPAAHYRWLPGDSLLSFDEIEAIVRVAVDLGVTRLRLTGGEPLLRPHLPDLVARLAQIVGLEDIALTTNGTRVAPLAGALRQAGLHRVTVSLDALDDAVLRGLSRHGRLSDILAGLDALAAAGFSGTKLNTVVIRGVNDDQLKPIVSFAAARGIEPRFIEYMDVGGATEWRADRVVSGAEIVARLGQRFGGATALGRGTDPHAPATRWRLGTGAVIGLVSSTTTPFCNACDRARLTADGVWYGCLYASRGLDLRTPLRAGCTAAALTDMLATAWRQRGDRGAEQRRATPDRSPLVSLGRLRRDPHLEMHVRGG